MAERQEDKIALAQEKERKRYERERKKLIADYKKKQRSGRGMFGDNIKLQEALDKLDRGLDGRLKRAKMLATPRRVTPEMAAWLNRESPSDFMERINRNYVSPERKRKEYREHRKAQGLSAG
jgi:hypothetical protein